jgi:hypothetical protein
MLIVTGIFSMTYLAILMEKLRYLSLPNIHVYTSLLEHAEYIRYLSTIDGP